KIEPRSIRSLRRKYTRRLMRPRQTHSRATQIVLSFGLSCQDFLRGCRATAGPEKNRASCVIENAFLLRVKRLDESALVQLRHEGRIDEFFGLVIPDVASRHRHVLEADLHSRMIGIGR